ncbi:F-box domain-containing protein [Carex littledalei]|uniref:F-box domain-containing protein n=1 Tax=Carex littledalei TaxID=544730 RepID=A0A833QY42_9POAL|nr:F-box domain-containing protein [Carex littledalei]
MEKEHKASLSTTGSNLSSWCWSHLPPELLDKIYALLSPSDRLRFRLTCSTWRGVARQSISPFPLPFEPPRLLVRGPDKGLFFFDIFNCKSRSCSIPPPFNKARCFGYLAGWFFLVSDPSPFRASLFYPPYRACLFNPVLLAEIPLPDLDSPIKKAILSAPPGFPNCLVAVTDWWGDTALCEPAGKRWQMLDFRIRFCDIIFWRNQLCGIVSDAVVLICNFDMESGKTSKLTVRLPDQFRYSGPAGAFLVESTGGDLLAVIVYDPAVSVFKLVQQCTWEQMERIGNQALFVGELRSESVPVNQFLDSGPRENSIYSTSSKTMVREGNYGIPIVYSMEDGAVRTVAGFMQDCIRAELVWVSPVIWP